MAGMASVGGFISKIMPWIGAAATGNVPALISMAAATVSKAVGKPVASSADSIAAAISGATPEQLLALKEADNDFAVKMQAMGFADVESLAKIAADDRADARARQVAMKDQIPAVLAFIVTLGFFGMLVCMWKFPPPAENKDLLLVMLGALGSAWASIIAFYFGSSSGQEKMTTAAVAK